MEEEEEIDEEEYTEKEKEEKEVTKHTKDTCLLVLVTLRLSFNLENGFAEIVVLFGYITPVYLLPRICFFPTCH